NNTPRFTEVPQTGVVVRKGPILDGLGSYVKERIPTDSSRPVNIQDLLKESGAEILVNLLPTGASRAARFYANEALRSGCAFVNATPSRLATDPLWRKRFQRAGLQLVGDDVKNQVGSTILHEALLSTLSRRGVRIRESYQLDIGGGMESLNALDRERYWIKRRVKIAAIRSVVPYRFQVAAGSSDYVEFMKNSRTSHFWIEGEYFGDARFTLDMTLDVVEGPACAAVLVDVVRAVKVAKDRGIYGAPTEICAYGFKMPPKRLAFDEASKLFASLASSRKR
ncbi:MAG: inositol-3-phosphate synthase, partial [Candidatus Bathyarchaeia archaeon]